MALFPYRAEIDLSGALLQMLGAGVPAIVYDIGGLGRGRRQLRRRRGRARRATSTPWPPRSQRLLDDADALAAARRGAERARDELTWDASAAAHLELYRELA